MQSGGMRGWALAMAMALGMLGFEPALARDGRDDRALAAQVQAALGQAGLEDHSIQVEVKDRVVQLSGFATSSAQISRAVDAAQGVEGVREVKNGLRLKPAAP